MKLSTLFVALDDHRPKQAAWITIVKHCITLQNFQTIECSVIFLWELSLLLWC